MDKKPLVFYPPTAHEKAMDELLKKGLEAQKHSGPKKRGYENKKTLSTGVKNK